MTSETELQNRSGGKCELCGNTTDVSGYELPYTDSQYDGSLHACATCQAQLVSGAELDMNHWRCLNDSMWSQEPAVQVAAYRMLTRLSSETWAQDLLDMLYLDDEIKAWADAEIEALAEEENTAPTLDSNGTQLAAGDTVVVIKDLTVKGTSFVAKRGTAVRNIALTNNPEHIEGRVNGTRIVILSCYVKKS